MNSGKVNLFMLNETGDIILKNCKSLLWNETTWFRVKL